MSRMTSTRPGARHLIDANVKVPETLTQEVIDAILSLDDTSIKYRYLKEVVLEKFVSDDTLPADARAMAAIRKWLSTERDNDSTEDRLLITPGEYNILPRVTWSDFVNHVRSILTDVLGEVVPSDVLLLGGFSGGATTTKSRTSSHPARKYLGKAEITSAAMPWFRSVLLESGQWAWASNQLAMSETVGNHMFTVPKSTVIDRVAAKEPDLNMYLQKGAGKFIRRRLRRFGINLNDQSINRSLAREGSITGRLATIDLSSASDSVSTALVELLLPPLWFAYLSDLRSPETRIMGEWHKNHMFSSMGNGFTFELESLLFWSIAKAVRYFRRGSGVISVYGDDIIVGTDYVDELIFVLGWCGFSVNSDKSFTSGPFRESCGGHYHDGNDVTPFFIRRPLKKIRDAILLANQIRKWSEFPYGGVLDPSLYHVWLKLKSCIPECLWGGSNLESDAQLVSPDRPRKPRRLVKVSGEPRHTDLGGYLLWLDTCEESTEFTDAVITSDEIEVLKDPPYRLRRLNAEQRPLTCLFFEEFA